ncbi:hypothetical protein JW948_18945 [bacterium]|nr:hypothetical protein [bacterium]
MTEKSRNDLKKYVEQWKKTGPILEEIRRKEIREINTTQVILNLSDAFDICLKSNHLRDSSGLVEMQSLLRRLRS